jgi:hypothetical protein
MAATATAEQQHRVSQKGDSAHQPNLILNRIPLTDERCTICSIDTQPKITNFRHPVEHFEPN